jgi:predicted GNAT family N-acyltransferase
LISDTKKFYKYAKIFNKEFKDEYSFIYDILQSCDNVFETYENGELICAFCTFNVSIGCHSGAYIYGAVTEEKHRGKGYFKRLLCEAKDFYTSKGYDFLITVPANESLFGLYKNLGFSEILDGVVSLSERKGKIFVHDNAKFLPFDGDFDNLYSLHKKNDVLVKERAFFEKCVANFDIKYIDGGYALFDNENLIYLVCKNAKYETVPKGTLMFLNKFDIPKNILCDILLEI